MLKALELAGFKSFADRTRFEFPPGITGVVGPNGSGKSNVVDAIKWVLGEQSVKSLRGKEMADVIFNGAVGRAPMNAAEATLTFDNSQKLLPVDTPEVLIGRRVYRNGESEYLINKQPVRLRDIRDLFSGTGAATEAYSVIEQGKVDVLLQSSPKERRSIFEEAAGISRFKARKLESLRRLERVDQNLLRLHDIVEEVENRLKSVRNQASKARRYQEHVDRLQQLRTHAARADWRKLSAQVAEQEAAAATKRATRDELTQRLDEAETRLLAIDADLGDRTQALRSAESQAADVRQRIAADESLIGHERRRSVELEEEASRHRRRLAALNGKAGDERTQVEATDAALHAAEARHAELVASRKSVEAQWEKLTARRREIETTVEERRRRMRELVQAAASAASDASILDAKLAACAEDEARRAERRAELDRRRAALELELNEHRDATTQSEHALAAATTARDAAKADLSRREAERTAVEQRVQELRQRQAGQAERADLLEDLLRRHEGIQAGVKEALGLKESDPTGPLRHVVGLAADLIRAPIDVATAVDAALAERAQYLVVAAEADPSQLGEFAAASLTGRVGFLSPAIAQTPDSGPNTSPAGKPGVVGRLDLLADFEETHRPLWRRLLGTTWLVESLELALELRREFAHLSFVTRRGEFITADGAIVAGRRSGGLGLVARRSELIELRKASEAIVVELNAAAKEIAVAALAIEAGQATLQSAEATRQERSEALAERRSRGKELDRQVDQLAGQRTALERDAARAETERAEVTASRTAAAARQESLRVELAEIETTTTAAQQQLTATADEARTVEERLTVAKVEAGKSEERLHHLKLEKLRCEQDRAERRKAVDESRLALDDCLRRMRQSTMTILDAESNVATAYLRQEAFAAEAATLAFAQSSLQRERTELASRTHTEKSRLRNVQDDLHALEMAAQTTRLERSNLADRIRDDYGLELSTIDAEPSSTEELQQREEVEKQIADLRRKINHIGNVNLEALAELDELESRYATLSQQFEDLTSAKKSLEGIIARIDADSRRLFTETLETVKGYFQILFRKLFGGGQADILLEENVDILDAGIEIIARPPGKEPRNISLLSGGEKTLTCVALLLAVFQYRPSPFCVLDEVDAALDEANIGRFVGVLQEFLSWTQFIIVTHSKRTMTCATTLYGVTMQESGISKRVAVRFQDVTDDGHIIKRPDADGKDTDAA
jgi:chromosome segregation protein